MHWVSRWVSLRSTHPTKLRSAPGINTRNAVDSPVSQGVYSFPPAHEGTLLEAILRWSSRAVRGGDSPRTETRSRSAETPDGGAAPAGGVRTPALGRPWGLVRAHY